VDADRPLAFVAHGQYRFKGNDDDPLEVFGVGLEGSPELAPPPDSEKARRVQVDAADDTGAWRPAVGLLSPTGWVGMARTHPRIMVGCAALLILVMAGIWTAYFRDIGTSEADLRRDWDDYERAIMTTGSLPFIQERGPRHVRGWKKFAEANNSRGMILYAHCLEQGLGVTKNEVEAVGWYRKAVEKDEPMAMTNLGAAYFTGRGVGKDEVEAVGWYRKAVEKDEPGVMRNLGACYFEGRGVTKDESKAIAWYRKAADGGEPGAMGSLGVCYYFGRGVTKDMRQAINWFSKAAEKGEPGAMTSLGICYYNGDGVAKDEGQAVNWYRKAAALKHGDAQVLLKSLGRQ
jgi:TPR repeat protein